MGSERAIVVGGGIGGLAVAHGLRERFAEVIVVERDRYPATASPRRGVPQGRCLHMLLGAGQRAIERLVPGFADALTKAGAMPFDVGLAGRLRLGHGWLPRERYGVSLFAASRALIEHTLRERVEAAANVRILSGHTVDGLRDGPRPEVFGTTDEDAAFSLPADLVVVSTGAGARLAQWLQPLGVPTPRREEVASGWRYVSAWFDPPDASEARPWRLLSIGPTAQCPAGGAIFEAEFGRWGAVLVLPPGEPLPKTAPQFVAACRALADPAMADALADARPIGAVAVHARGSSHWLRYDEVRPWPRRVVAIGDAVAAFDPYFGLGMSACLLAAQAVVEAPWSRPGTAAATMREIGQRLAAPWSLVSERHHASAADGLLHRSLVRLAPHDSTLAAMMVRRMHLLEPPDVFARPHGRALLLRAARGR